MAPIKQNGYITWTSFLVVLGLILTGGIALNTIIWNLHSKEQIQFEKRMLEQFDNVKSRLNRIDQKLDKIK